MRSSIGLNDNCLFQPRARSLVLSTRQVLFHSKNFDLKINTSHSISDMPNNLKQICRLRYEYRRVRTHVFLSLLSLAAEKHVFQWSAALTSYLEVRNSNPFVEKVARRPDSDITQITLSTDLAARLGPRLGTAVFHFQTVGTRLGLTL